MIIEAKIRDLIIGYAEAIDESRGDVPMGRLFCGGYENYPELCADVDLVGMIRWIEGVAAAAGTLPETLIETCRKRAA